jgi:glycine dehydrogenase subunit 1
MHLAILGKGGLRELAVLNYRRARYAREKLGQLRFSGPTFNEFVVQADAKALAKARAAGIVAGLPLDRDYPELAGGLLTCVTELHDKARIDALAQALR